MGRRIAMLVAAMLVAAPRPALADTPWSEGIGEEQKQAAQRLLDEGNDHFVENRFTEALAKYQEAIGHWDHPAIRFNVVRTLIALDRPLDAYDNLERALAHGAEPLEAHVYTEALNYQRLLAGQIAELEVTCAQDGVAISVDGEAFLSCPGARTKRVLPGAHAIVGTRDGFMTATRDVLLLPGKHAPIEITLETVQEAAVTRQRWATWKPWAVAGGGAALAGLGVLLNVDAGAKMDQFVREVAARCTDTGCSDAELEGSLSDLESLAILENRVAIGMMIAGGAVVVTGITLVILNRPRTVLPVPTVSGEGAGLSLITRF